MNAAGKAQIGRVLRLVLFTLFSSAIVVNLVNAWAVRYPMIGLALGLLEATYRTAVPTVPAPSVAAVLAPPASSPTAPPGSGTP